MSNEPSPALARKLNNAAIAAFVVIAVVLLIVFSVSSNLVLRGILGVLMCMAGLALMATTFWVMVLQAERRHFRRKKKEGDTEADDSNTDGRNTDHSNTDHGNADHTDHTDHGDHGNIGDNEVRDINRSNGTQDNRDNRDNTREVNPGE